MTDIQRTSLPSTGLRRRSIVTGVAGMAAALALPFHSARAAQQIRAADITGSGLKAFFEASGEGKGIDYDVSWSRFPAGQPVHEAFNAGAIDVSRTGDSVFLFAYGAGSPARAVNAYVLQPTFMELVVQPKSGIKTVADLKGKKLAVNSGGGPHLMAFDLLEQAGVAREDVQLVFLTPTDAKPAFASGAVDAWLSWAPYSTLAKEQNGGIPIANLSNNRLYSGNDMLLVHKDTAAGKRALVEDFLGRTVRAHRWALANVEEGVNALSRDTKLDKKVARAILADYRPTLVGLTPAVRRSFRNAAEGFQRYGMIKQPIANIDGAFDASFAQATA
ncbi:MAG: aliphatic sulfonate ABC transporter substrate-binding protein [Pseudomonadota bacterium]